MLQDFNKLYTRYLWRSHTFHYIYSIRCIKTDPGIFTNKFVGLSFDESCL
jgi:hypothetical protein